MLIYHRKCYSNWFSHIAISPHKRIDINKKKGMFRFKSVSLIGNSDFYIKILTVQVQLFTILLYVLIILNIYGLDTNLQTKNISLVHFNKQLNEKKHWKTQYRSPVRMLAAFFHLTFLIWQHLFQCSPNAHSSNIWSILCQMELGSRKYE